VPWITKRKMRSSACARPAICNVRTPMNLPFAVHTKAALSRRASIRIVIVGHVDHGKSTLIGRLLHETGSLATGKLESLKAVAARRGVNFEWSFLLDALQIERNQGITVDTSQIRFRTQTRDVLLIDAPGHAEFLRNMITGAAQADAAILIVDAVEGIREQTRRHAYLLHLLGIRQVAVVINKMDRVDFGSARYEDLRRDIRSYMTAVGLDCAAVPISARHGDGISRRSERLAWYKGPTVLEALDEFEVLRPAAELPLRMPVQAIYKFNDKRILAGRIETGVISVGDAIVIAPDGKLARVNSIESWPVRSDAPRRAVAGQSIGITLDQDIFVERGNIIARSAAPPASGNRLRARVFWLGRDSLEVGARLVARIGTAESSGTVTAIANGIDPGTLSAPETNTIQTNHIGDIEIALSRQVASDPYALNPGTGRVAIEVGGRIVGGGLVLSLDDSAPIVAKARRIRQVAAEQRIAIETPELVAKAARLSALLQPLSPVDRLRKLREQIAGRIVFTTSFGLEDQVILQMLVKSDIDIDVVTLDTGRLFPQTYDLWAETEQRLGWRIRAIYPRHDDVAGLVDRHGINGFYQSREARQSCCHVRKVEPLNRALAGAEAWITGLRAEQSAGRRDMALVSAEIGYRLIKLNPLFDWTRQAVQAFAAAESLPINPLHAKGFASIGCAPCTRAIAPGEPERAGRWWWEDETKKECGLHTGSDGPILV
jgi:sulfate adenylyltransferase large subunit/phosphoadenylyl-sulfate reductase (thioredoxin)